MLTIDLSGKNAFVTGVASRVLGERAVIGGVEQAGRGQGLLRFLDQVGQEAAARSLGDGQGEAALDEPAYHQRRHLVVVLTPYRGAQRRLDGAHGPRGQLPRGLR